MTIGKRVKGIIFDVGGTLIYSNHQHFEHANAWAAALTLRGWGYELEGETFARDLVELRRRSPKEGEDFRQINTTREALIEATKRCGIRLDDEEVGRLERAFYTPEIEGSVALPSTEEVVRDLQPHVKLAVITLLTKL